MSVNLVILVGNLGKDPEVRHTQTGRTVANFSIATSKKWKSQKDGEMQEKTEWHRIVVWGNTAEACGKYLSKGRSVMVRGEIQNRSYEDKEGNTRYISEILAQQVQFLGGGQGQGEGRGQEEGQGQEQASGYGYQAPPPPENDDIPF